MRIDRDRARPRRVDADADDARGVEAGLGLRGGERASDALLGAVEIVVGALAGEAMVAVIEQDALRAAGIVDDAGAELRAVGAAHDQRAHRVGAKIKA